MKTRTNERKITTIMSLGKKLSIAAIIALTLISTAFANVSGAPVASGAPNTPHFKGVENFIKAFPQATDVNYKIKERYTEVSFTWNNLKLEAFFDREGSLIGTSRAMAINDLPISFQVNLKNDYPGFVATEAIEFDHVENGVGYYVTVVSLEKSYVLHVSNDGTIDVFKKMKN
jgi:hypothetical protein